MDGFVLASDLASHILRSTEEVWRQGQGDSTPVDVAHVRLFGAGPGLPLWLCAAEHEGRTVVLRLYARGRVHIYDPWRGSSIRVLRKVTDQAANMSAALSDHNPYFARLQRDRYQAFAIANQNDFHAKVGGAVQSFFNSR